MKVLHLLPLTLFAVLWAQPGEVSEKLMSSLRALQEKPKASSEATKQFASDLMALAEVHHRPSPSSIQALADHLASALAGRKLSADRRARLADDLRTVLQSAGISTVEINSAINSIQTTLLPSVGVAKKQAQTIGQDLARVAAEVRGPQDLPVLPPEFVPPRR